MSPIHRIFLSASLTLLFLIALGGCSGTPYTSSDDDDSASDDDDAAGDDDDAAGDDDDATGDDDDVVGDDDDDVVGDDDDDVVGDDDDSTGDDDDTTGDDDDVVGDDDDAASSYDPEQAGPFTWTQSTPNDTAGELFVPSGAGPFPVVLFAPGFQLNPVDYISYGEHFASWGYITLLVDFEGGLFGGPNHAQLAEDLGEAIDWIESNPAEIAGLANPNQLGLVGHSMGGKISLLRAASDARVDVVAALDPVDSGPPFGGSPEDYPSVTPELMPQIAVPLLLIGEQTNAVVSGLGQACAPADQNFQQYYDAATSPVLEIDVLGAFHMSFLDNPGCIICLACPTGSDNPLVTKSLSRGLITGFFESELRGDVDAGNWIESSDPGGFAAQGLVTTRSKNGF